MALNSATLGYAQASCSCVPPPHTLITLSGLSCEMTPECQLSSTDSIPKALFCVHVSQHPYQAPCESAPGEQDIDFLPGLPGDS